MYNRRNNILKAKNYFPNDTLHFKEMLSNLKGTTLQNETVSTINLFTGAGIKINTEGEVTDVCLAIQEIKQAYADEQVAKAIAIKLIDYTDNLMKNFSISLEQACRVLEHTVDDYHKAKELLEKTTS